MIMSKNKKSNYYDVPEYPRRQTNVITIFGVMMFAAVMAGVLYICPWKPSEGLVSIDYSMIITAREDMEISPDEPVINAEFLDNLFETGTLQSGGYVQKKADEEYHLYYTNRWMNYYQTMELDDGLEAYTNVNGLEHTGLYLGEHFVSITDDNRILYQNMDNYVRKEFEFDWKESVTKDGQYDYCKVTRLLDPEAGKPLSIREAAAIAGLIQENILVGYQNGEAWFFVPEDSGLMKLVRSNSESWEVAMDRIDNPGIYAMVANGTYLILDYEDHLSVIHIADFAGYSYPIKNDHGEEPVLGFSYSVRNDIVTVYQYGETTMQWLTFRDHEVKASDIQHYNYYNADEGVPSAISVTMNDEIEIVWHRLEDDYHWYKLGGAK